MRRLGSRPRIMAAALLAAALVWTSGALAAGLPQSELLRAGSHAPALVDYATDVVTPGSRFITSRPSYDQ